VRQLVGHRCQQHRPVESLAQQLQAGVGLGQVRQRLGQQADAVQCLAVVRQRMGLVAAAFDVRPGMGFNVVARLARVVGQGPDTGGDARQRRLYGLAQRIERRRQCGGGACHASDHMRSRLW
jgi:hypothetical protein